MAGASELDPVQFAPVDLAWPEIQLDDTQPLVVAGDRLVAANGAPAPPTMEDSERADRAGVPRPMPVAVTAPMVCPSPPIHGSMAEDLARVSGSEGWRVAIAVSSPLLLAPLPFLGLLATAIYWAALVGYAFRIIDHFGRGRPGLPLASDDLDSVSSIAEVLFRGACCAVAVMLPVLLWWTYGASPSTALGAAAAGAAFRVAGSLLGPALLITTCMTGSGLSTLNPLAWLTIISRFPGDYLRHALLFAGFELCAWGCEVAVAPVVTAVPLFGAVLVAALIAVLRLCQAAVVGGLVRRHADAFGIQGDSRRAPWGRVTRRSHADLESRYDARPAMGSGTVMRERAVTRERTEIGLENRGGRG
ncbi:MAG: hypothetical protein V3V08_10400 [Nannocystaceae bacterium]